MCPRAAVPFLIGIVLYVGSRLFSGEEEKTLAKTFGGGVGGVPRAGQDTLAVDGGPVARSSLLVSLAAASVLSR